MLLANERWAQHVMDPTIKDDDDGAMDGLAIDDARQVPAGWPDQDIFAH